MTSNRIMKTNGFTALSSLLLTVNQEFSKTEDVIFGAPSPIYRISMDIHIYRETLYISAWKPLLTGFNHFSFTGCPLRWKLKEILITVYIGCNDSSQLRVQ